MDKAKLKQFNALKKEQAALENKLEQLYKRQENVPVVMGKVTGSSHTFPYTPVRTSVEMDEPVESDTIKKLIWINNRRKKQVDALIVEINEFISSIPDSMTRQIFEMVYLKRMKLDEVGDMFGYTKGRISQIITEYLQ